MTIVVSDTSPIRALGHLGRMGLLRDLYAEVFVPPAVATELRDPAPRLTPLDVGVFPFIRVQAPVGLGQVAHLLPRLHAGELEAPALAPEIRADLVLIDEAAGRVAAR